MPNLQYILDVVLKDTGAKKDIAAIEAELKKIKDLGETGIKVSFDKDGNVLRVFSQLKNEAGAFVAYTREWDEKTKSLVQKTSTIGINYEKAAKEQVRAAKEIEQANNAMIASMLQAQMRKKQAVEEEYEKEMELAKARKDQEVELAKQAGAEAKVLEEKKKQEESLREQAKLSKENYQYAILLSQIYQRTKNENVQSIQTEFGYLGQVDDVQRYTDVLTGVTREQNRINSETSVFAKMSDEAYGNYLAHNGMAFEANEYLSKSAENAANSQRVLGNETEKAGEKAGKSAKSFTLLHTVFLRLAHTAISLVTRSFREALTEMKNVDSELVVVRKVSDATAKELEVLKNRAYEVGAAYGVAASDYLNAAAEMSRAGYREQAGDLAELATKIQLVGDVSQDVANKFLIATDKSYKMNGNFQKLSSTIDKLNEIDNNFATSFEKVADGIGLLAPVAAQAHVSFEEMAAAIGTVTAVTQRSGTESARALRSLFLNILRDTKTEIDDGVTWTIEEVNNLQDALKKYAPEVVKAAEATGQLINPMEAVGALAQSYKDGLLTEEKLFEIVSGLGGKLRTSQLLALIQNWDMYNTMLEKTADAAGSADKEVGNALDSWDKKLQQLKNTFTQFTQSLLDSGDIKGFIDSMNYLLKSIENPEEYEDLFANTFENAVSKLVERLPRIQKVINQVAVSIIKTFLKTVKDQVFDVLKELADGSSKATREFANALPDIFENLFSIISEVAVQSLIDSDLAYNLTASLIDGIIEAIPRVISGSIGGIIDAFSGSFDKGVFDFAANKIANRKGIGGKITRWFVNTIIGEDLFDPNGGFAKSPEKVTAAIDAFASKIEESVNPTNEAKDAVEEITDAFDEQTEATENAISALEKYKKALEGGEKGDDLKSYAEAYKSAVEMFEKGLTGTNAYMSAIDLLFDSGIVDTYEEAGELLGNKFIKAMFEEGGDDFGANAANYIREHLDEFKGVAINEAGDGTFSLIVEDMEAFAKSANLSVGAVESLLDALDGYDSKTLDGEIQKVNGFTEEEHPIDIPVGDEKQADEFFTHVENWIDKLDGSSIAINLLPKISAADYLKNPIWGGIAHATTTKDNVTRRTYASGTGRAHGGNALVNEEGAEIIAANGRAWIAGGGNPVITNIPNGATVFSAKETTDIFRRSGIASHKDGIGENTDTGGYGGYRVQADKVQAVIDAADDLTADRIPVNRYRNKDKSSSSSASSILSEISEYIEDILEKAKEALQEQLDAIDEQIEKLQREHDAEEDANKLEELRLKILEAEKKLAEAENERTVRYFNKETGQWEWMADQKAVADAQKALQEAQDAYNKEVAEQAYQAQIQALQDQKDSLNEAYNQLADNWYTIYKELQDILNGKSSVDIANLIQQLLGTKGGSYAPDIQALLEAIGAFTDNPTSVLDAETTAKIMSIGAGGGTTPLLSAMLGTSSYDLNQKGQSTLGGNTSIVGDTIYYINGVQIGSDMMDKPLSQILSVLPIYAN